MKENIVKADVMQLGFVSAILPDLSLGEVIEFAAATGYECVEVMCWPPGKADRRYAGVTHVDVTRLDPAEAADISALCVENRVAISALGYYPNVLSPNAEDAAAHSAASRASDPGSAAVGRRSGDDVRRAGLDSLGRRQLAAVSGNLDAVGAAGGRVRRADRDRELPDVFLGRRMAGRKESGEFARDLAADVRRRFRARSFGLNFDPSHFVWQQMDYLLPLAEFAPRLFHVHAKDVRIDRQRLNDVGLLAVPSAYHSPKLPGLGDIAWGPFFSVLGEIGYRGPVCVEVEDRSYEHSLAARGGAAAIVALFTETLSRKVRFAMNYTYEDLAGMIDHSLLHPTMTDAELDAGCAIAAKYRVASVCIKPYAVRAGGRVAARERRARWLRRRVSARRQHDRGQAIRNRDRPAATARSRSTWSSTLARR